MVTLQPVAESSISSKDRFQLPEFCCPPTSPSGPWLELERSPEQILGDIVEDRLAQMRPQEADAAIERGREILASCKSQEKRR